METLIVGERGQITIPSNLRKKYNIKSKQPVILEEKIGAGFSFFWISGGKYDVAIQKNF